MSDLDEGMGVISCRFVRSASGTYRLIRKKLSLKFNKNVVYQKNLFAMKNVLSCENTRFSL